MILGHWEMRTGFLLNSVIFWERAYLIGVVRLIIIIVFLFDKSLKALNFSLLHFDGIGDGLAIRIVIILRGHGEGFGIGRFEEHGGTFLEAIRISK